MWKPLAAKIPKCTISTINLKLYKPDCEANGYEKHSNEILIPAIYFITAIDYSESS